MEVKKKSLWMTSIVVGFALFSTYFGAGNLIFPPFIGLMTGSDWALGNLGMTLSAIFLPIIAVVGIYNAGGSMDTIMRPLGNKFKIFFLFINYTFLALGSTLPRCAATTYEMGLEPLFPQVPIWASSIVFFAIFYYFARNKESVVDKLGKILTPALLILLIIVVFNVFTKPIGTPVPTGNEKPFVDALLNGYLTGDLTLGILIGAMFISALRDDIDDEKEVRKGLYIACGITFLGLFIVYSGLCYGGACLSGDFPLDTERTTLLIEIIYRSLGKTGFYLLGIAVTLACLTTSIGLGANAADFLEELTGGRVKYRQWILVIAILCCLLSIQGVTGLVNYVTPIFTFLYPAFIVLTALGLFDRHVPNDGVYKGAIIAACIFGALDAINIVINSPGLTAFISKFPLGSHGFAWLIPTIIAGVIGYFIYRGRPRATVLK